jgi:DNA-binding Lrp family transcriptional regulator
MKSFERRHPERPGRQPVGQSAAARHGPARLLYGLVTRPVRCWRAVAAEEIPPAVWRRFLNGVPKLDRIDLNILVQLQKDGRMTNANLADAVGLSASPCLQRVKRLESAGYITGYGAQINLAKLTESIGVFTEITLVDHRKEDFVKFEASMRNVDELMECHLVSGGYDYLLRFVCRNISHYQERMENLLERNIGIEKYFSYIVLKSPIVKNALPLKALLDTPQ